MNSNIKKLSIVICCLFLFILSASMAYSEPVEIRILHINDFHGFAEPYKPFGSDRMLGGITYLSGLADKLRKEKPTLLLAAGDMIRGNNWSDLFQGASVIELMNLMEFDAMVVGNHEFDFGQDVLKKRISEAKFPVIGANVKGLDFLRPYVVKEINGVKIAIIGVVTKNTPVTTHPNNIVGLKFTSPYKTAEKYIKKLKNKVDIIVVLSHIGYNADRTLAERVKDIDVIIGGHSHTMIESPVLVGKTIITQASEHAMKLGVLDLTIEHGKIVKFSGHLEDIAPSLTDKDEAVSQLVKKYKQKVDDVLSQKVGEAGVDLDGENVRKRETNLGNLIADIMRETSSAEVAIINGGTIRSSIKKGEVLAKNIYSAVPFNNYIVAIRLTGIQIKEALEHGVSAVEEGEGRFPQVSGLKFTYSISSRAGSRIREIYIAGKPIEPKKEYIVATNDFLAAGGDGYKVFGKAIKASRDFSNTGGTIKSGKIVYNSSDKWIKDVIIEYIKARKKIFPVVEGRIKEI